MGLVFRVQRGCGVKDRFVRDFTGIVPQIQRNVFGQVTGLEAIIERFVAPAQILQFSRAFPIGDDSPQPVGAPTGHVTGAAGRGDGHRVDADAFQLHLLDTHASVNGIEDVDHHLHILATRTQRKQTRVRFIGSVVTVREELHRLAQRVEFHNQHVVDADDGNAAAVGDTGQSATANIAVEVHHVIHRDARTQSFHKRIDSVTRSGEGIAQRGVFKLLPLRPDFDRLSELAQLEQVIEHGDIHLA